MAKKKSPATAAAAVTAEPSPPPATPRLAELERLWDAGHYVGARRQAKELLAGGDAAEQARARELLAMMQVDRVPLMVFAGMLVVMAIVFVNAIVTRNNALKDAPPSIELNKQLA